MSKMAYGPTVDNQTKGNWAYACGIKSVPGDGCVWIYKSFSGESFLGMDTSGREGYFGRDNFASVDALWSWIGGRESWLRLSGSLRPMYVPPPTPSISKSITDSNPAKRGTDIARAISTEETAVRTTVDIAHAIGGVAATLFGAGALVPIIGDLQKQGLDARYGKR